MPYVETLSGEDVELGRKLWQALRTNKTFPANGVFWLFRLESGVWHLVIVTPRADIVGPRAAYAELAAVAKGLIADSFPVSKVELMSPKNPFYQALRSVFGAIPSVEGTRLTSTQIGGMFIDEAYLYEIR